MFLKLNSLKKEEYASDHITLLQEGIFKHIISKKKKKKKIHEKI